MINDGQRTQFPEWRNEHEPTRYPFSLDASLTNSAQLILEGTVLDAALYPIGGGPRLRLSRVVVSNDTVTVTIGDNVVDLLASGSFDVVAPPDRLVFNDTYGRPAGLLISEPARLSLFAAWGVGTFDFSVEQTEFCASVCFPTPAVGVQGVRLADGTVLTGDVWLVGDEGVVLRNEQVTVANAACGGGLITYEVIRVDVVGDPLFRRRLCTPSSLFETPRFLRTLTFQDGIQTVVCGPGENGDVKVTVNNALADDTVLRVHPTASGNKFDVVGSLLKSVR